MPDGGLDILYVSGSLGLGHVQRDLGVARALRAQCPRVDIRWIAGSPAREALLAAGQRLAPEAQDYRCETDLAEATARAGRLNLTSYTYRALAAWFHNARLIGRAARRGGYDAVVGDETYEILVANFFGYRVLPPIPFVMMYDFLGMESTTEGVAEKLGAWALNLIWSQEWRVTRRGRNAAVFFGELEDVPERRFGWLLPQRRRYAQESIEFVGYVLPFAQEDMPRRDASRRQLGYGDEPVVVCSVGGTSLGRGLLELCGLAFPLAAKRSPGLRMVVVAGPRIDPDSLDLPAGVERRDMVDSLWRHFAAADLAVVQGGGTTTLELEVLRTPFLYFPIEGHAEQEVTVAGRLARHGAGVRMQASTTTPAALADAILAHLGDEVSYPPVVADGAWRAATRILEAVNACLVGEAVVDAGTPWSTNKLLAALEGHPVAAHALTHAHPDHRGSTAALCAARSIPLWCGADDRHRNPLSLSPGLREASRLITRDPLQHRRSIRKIAALRPRLVCFGHGPPLSDGDRFVRWAENLGVSGSA